MVEIEINTNTPPGLLIPFAIHTAVLIFLHLFSLMLATFILPELEAVGDLSNPAQYSSALKIAKSFTVQLCWILSNIVGIILFLLEIIFVAFVKFFPAHGSSPRNIHAATATVLILVILSLCGIPVIIYQSRILSKYKLQLHEKRLSQAQQMLADINQQMTLHLPENFDTKTNVLHHSDMTGYNA